MPEGLGEARQSDHHTPEQEGDAEPKGPTSVVSQEPRKEPGQRVEVVEYRPRHDLVGEARATVGELTHLRGQVCVVVVEDWSEVATVALIHPVGSDSWAE